MTSTQQPAQVDAALIDELFDRNVEELEAEGTKALSPWIRDLARMQVQLYWRRLETIARQVSETEVRLQLPAQHSPAGRTFGIEGIVDIVRAADGSTTMYDIKTHDAEYVRENTAHYARQLNVYAHIWQELRGNRLDATAVICTALPNDLETAWIKGDLVALANALSKWDPVIPITFDARGVETTIEEFGSVVDRIESHDFTPPTYEQLCERVPGTRSRFAVYVCRNCDARYSCRSYQRYVFGDSSRTESVMRTYLGDLGDEDAREDFAVAALEIEPPLGDEE